MTFTVLAGKGRLTSMQPSNLHEEQSELIVGITEVNQRMSYLNKNILCLQN